MKAAGEHDKPATALKSLIISGVQSGKIIPATEKTAKNTTACGIAVRETTAPRSAAKITAVKKSMKMSKYKKGIVEDIKKEKVFEENQQHLKDKYNMTGEAVVIVEKNNLLKYLIKYGVALIKLVVTIAILVLATLGVLTIVYPNSRHELLFVLEDIYSQMCVYLPFLSSLR